MERILPCLFLGSCSDSIIRTTLALCRSVVILTLLLWLIFTSAAVGQNNPNEEQALKPYDSWHGGDIDSVSLTNGGLSLKIPLVDFPQRGNQDLSFFIRFSNKQWVVQPPKFDRSGHQISPAKWTPGQPGGQVVSSVDWWLQSSNVIETCTDPNGCGQTLYDWSTGVSAPEGNVHQFGGAVGGLFPGLVYPLRSLDSTGILHPNLYTVILANGTQYSYPSADFNSQGSDLNGGVGSRLIHVGIQPTLITDANGNQITIGPSGWTDTLGRAIPGSTTTQFGPVQPGVPTSDLSTCPSGTSSALIWSIPGFNNSTRTFKFCYAMFTLQTSFTNSAVNYGPASTSLLSAVVLPDLTTWTFAYDSYGDITRLGFPTGGSLSYTYEIGPPSCSSGTNQSVWVTSRTLDASDGAGGHTWQYNYQTSGTSLYSHQGTATVTDPLGNDTVHQISNPVASAPCSGYDVQTQYYQGSSAPGSGGTLLKTIQTQYTGTTDNFDNGSYFEGIDIVPTQVTTTLPNGGTSMVINSYDLPTPQVSGDQVIIGSPLEKDEYDFTGSLLRSILMHYLWQDNSTYKTANFTSLPLSTTIKDNTGCEVAKTSYGYDETYAGITLQNAQIPTQHVAAPGAVRGNRTSTSSWLISQCVEQSATVTHTIPFDTGMPYQSVDAVGNTTTFSYSSTFAGAYLTQSQLPNTNGIQHAVSANYDLNTGRQTGFTDQNLNSSTFVYDNMLRLTTANHAGGGQTILSYPNATTIDRQRLLSPGIYSESKVLFDGVGRPIQGQNVSPSGTALVDTTYDALGRVSTVSNPYYSGTNHSTDPTYGLTQTQYDALDRVLSITEQDGSVESSDYTQPLCPIQTDEAGKSHQTCTDALGRLTAAFEDPAGLHYETDYAYDPMGNLTTITQKGGTTDSSQWRIRSFTYDSLSRLLTAANPEAGTLSYSYDGNGNMATKTAPAPNQSGGGTITMTYSYDPLNRVIQKTYSDGTPAVHYLYDTSLNWGVIQSNLIGRIAEIYEDNPARGDEIFSYDEMGDLIINNQCTPSNCGTANWTVAATYNLIGNITSLTYPSGRIVNYGYNAGDQLDQVQFKSYNGTPPVEGTYNYWSVSDTNFYPNGTPKSWTLGNAISESNLLNSRLQTQQQVINNPAIATFADHTYGYGARNNGSVLTVTDNRNSARTQTFTYDSLNRLSTGSEGRWGLAWVYDAYGNNLQQNVTAGSAFGHQYTATVKNQLGGFSYDAAGNLLNDALNQYTYDAEDRINTVNGTAVNYVYAANGQRVKKSVGSTSTEYVRFNGNIIAEYNPGTGDWSDYIFASGRRIARALALDNGLRIYGTRCGSCGNQYTLFYVQNAAGLANYTITTGDKLNMTQYQTTGSRGGIVFVFTDGTSSNWNVKDQDGNFMNDDQTQGTAHVRDIDLSFYAGKTIQSVLFNQETDTAPGSFAIIYEQVSLTSANGTVRPIYTGESSSPVSSIVPTSGITGAGTQIDINRNKAIYPTSETTYYHTNQVGSSTVITAGNGWPVWQATFLPYGEEYNPELSDGEHFKFSGEERDSETGLDYLSARYYGNGLGRFITPDQLGGHQEDPQTLNKYSYVRNIPTVLSDPSGLDFNLDCGEESTTCHNGVAGKAVSLGNGNWGFQATVIGNDDQGNLVDKTTNTGSYSANVTGGGVQFTQAGSNQSAMGTFINGTSPTVIQDPAHFPGFTFTFTYSNLAGGVNAGGTFTYSGTYSQAESALLNAGFMHYTGDETNIFHPSGYDYNAVDFRTAGQEGTGANSGHVTVEEPKVSVGQWGMRVTDPSAAPTNGTLHLGEHNPFSYNREGFWPHTGEVIRTLIQWGRPQLYGPFVP